MFAGRTDRAIAEDVFKAHGIENNRANWLAFRRSYLQQLRISLPQHSGQILTGVVELLEHLRRIPDHHLGLLTGNIREGAKEKLRHYGLWDRFDFGGFGDESVSRDDVARAALADATRHLSHEILPNDVYVVGDTVHDIRCARAIGARAIAVATGGSTYDELAAESPDHLWADLSEWREQLADLWRT